MTFGPDDAPIRRDTVIGLTQGVADVEARLSGSLDPVQHEHGDRWDISQEDDGWTAVRRGETPTAQHVIAARTLAELAAKLAAEADAG